MVWFLYFHKYSTEEKKELKFCVDKSVCIWTFVSSLVELCKCILYKSIIVLGILNHFNRKSYRKEPIFYQVSSQLILILKVGLLALWHVTLSPSNGQERRYMNIQSLLSQLSDIRSFGTKEQSCLPSVMSVKYILYKSSNFMVGFFFHFLF